MTELDKLYPQAVKDQCTAAIKTLEQDSLDIEKVQKHLQDFMIDDELVSESYHALKLQISDYLSVISAMITANDMDIADMQTLSASVGTQNLIGSVILPARDEAQKEMNICREESARYREYANDEPWWSFLKDIYSDLADFYSMLAWFAEQRYEEWKEKAELYDYINNNTQNLLTQSAGLRAVAKQGIASITKSFQNGVYVVDMNAPWRTGLSEINDELLEQTKANYMKENESGELEYDWDKIQELLEKDVDEVSDMEYLALVDMMSEMSDEELAALFSCSTIEFLPFSRTYYSISEVLQEASERYITAAQVIAELTFMNAHSEYEYDETEVINYFSKAFFIDAVIKYMSAGGVESYQLKIYSEESEKDGKITYNAELVYTLETPILYRADAPLPPTELRKITMNPWGSTARVESDLKDNVEYSLKSLGNNNWDVAGKGVSSEVIGYVTGKLGDIVAKPVAVLNLVNDLKENQDRNIVINGGLNALAKTTEVEALAIKAGVLYVSGTGVNEVTLISPQYDREELTVRVAAYNSAQTNEENIITVDMLKEEVEKKEKDENEKTILDRYLEWYRQDGDEEIKEYWGALEDIIIEYKGQNPELELCNAKKMSVDQLQELINKKNDSSYEINIEVMKGSN